jgi:purine-nucleoside phosphorylase
MEGTQLFLKQEKILIKGKNNTREKPTANQRAWVSRLLWEFGVKSIVLIDAGLGTKSWEVFLPKDHINLSGDNPLIGLNKEQYGPRFPDMSRVYSSDLRKNIYETFHKKGIPWEEGIIVEIPTTRELESLQIPPLLHELNPVFVEWTVAEAITARHAGLEVVSLVLHKNGGTRIIDTLINFKFNTN